MNIDLNQVADLRIKEGNRFGSLASEICFRVMGAIKFKTCSWNLFEEGVNLVKKRERERIRDLIDKSGNQCGCGRCGECTTKNELKEKVE